MIPRNVLITFCVLFLSIYTLLHFNQKQSREELLFAEQIEIDSNYFDVRLDSQILKEKIYYPDQIEVPAITEWSEIIRIRGQDGWGEFDYICSIFGGERPRIQIIKQYPREWRRNVGLGYTYMERFITQVQYDSLWQELIDQQIHMVTLDETSQYRIMDGNEFYIAMKSGNFMKKVYWQEPKYVQSESKKRAVFFFYELLKFVQFPSPTLRINFWDMRKDSAFYSIYLDAYEYVDSCIFQYSGNIHRDSITDYEMNLSIPLQDTLNIEKRVAAKAIMLNGDTITIKEFNFLDRRKK